MNVRLDEQQIREVLSRAEEIHLRAALASGGDPAIESVLAAAEEMGVPREAMRIALHERLGRPMKTPDVGDLVFARSADGNFYVANVLDAASSGIRVRFLSGAEHTLPESDLQECNFLPGAKVVVPWPVWGWYRADVVSYDAKKGKVLVSDGWNEKKFSLSEIRLDPPKSQSKNVRTKVYWALISLGAAMGGTLGALITWLLMR
ncbi:MAG: tudor domain-containing protein [Armatimonadota bacterium]|nr:tudor domain-containing protein [Armatimonadota bacterium]